MHTDSGITVSSHIQLTTANQHIAGSIEEAEGIIYVLAAAVHSQIGLIKGQLASSFGKSRLVAGTALINDQLAAVHRCIGGAASHSGGDHTTNGFKGGFTTGNNFQCALTGNS